MDKFLAFFGKLVLLLVVGGALVSTGVYVGKKYSPSSQVTPTPSQTELGIPPTGGAKLIVTPTTSAGTTFAAGGVLVFKQYIITILPGWTSEVRMHVSNIDDVVISKGTYTLQVYEAPYGGGLCLYPGDPAFNGPSQQFTQFVGIAGKVGQFRRGIVTSPTPTRNSYTVCQQKSGQFADVTEFGRIGYSTPTNPDSTTLTEMDQMVASMQVK